MRGDRCTVTCGGVSDAPPFRDPAANRSIRLQNRSRTFIQNLLKSPAPCFDLSGRNTDSCSFCKPRMVINLIRTEGLLNPIGFVFFVALAELERGRNV